MRRKAQADATSAASLVAVIAALIVIYILFLPPEARDELLSGNETNATSGASTAFNNTLLSERPEHLSYVAESEFTHELPAINLYKLVNSVELKTENAFRIKNSWFDKSFKTITFGVPDIGNTENVIMTFTAPIRKGTLIIKLNEAVIYEEQLATANSPLLSLSKDLLKSSNTLDFEVSPVGAAFWKTNEYSINTLKIVGDVTDLSRQEAKAIFMIGTSEKYNIDRASIKFVPDCITKDTGVLDISINGINIYSAVPDCKSLNKVNMPAGLLESGENTAKFKTSKGSYLTDQIKVVTTLKEAPSTIYYFDVSDKQYGDIQNGTKEVHLNVKLIKTGEIVEAKFIINGHTTTMRTRDDTFTKVINPDWMLKGDNYVKIEPETDLDILTLKVELEDVE